MAPSVRSRSEVRVLLALTVLFSLSSVVQALPQPGSKPDEDMLYKALSDFIHQTIISDLTASSPSEEDLVESLIGSHFFSRAPVEPPSFSDLIRSAVQDKIAEELKGANSLLYPERRELSQRNDVRKRGFDSISQSSGFGAHQSSWGGENRNNENLSFTFESLFPAIARGLRSTK